MAERKMGLFGVTSLTLVALIGTGLFFGPAISASYAGVAAIIAWIVLGLQSIYVGFLFAELASMFPRAGGIYEFAKNAYGRFPSFLIGWIMWLVATINTSILIVGALEYAFPFLPFVQKLAASLVLVVILHFIAYRGLGASEAILDFFAASLLVFVILTIVGGVFHINPANYQPFVIGKPIMLLVALFFILETYFGWEAACFLAEETKEPQKNIPRAIVISTIIGAILGIGLTAVLYGIIPAATLAKSPAPLTDAFAIIFGATGALILKIGIFLALIGSAAGNIVSGPRLLLAMARDKLFIEQLADRSPRTGTPAKAILFQGIVSALVLLAAFGNYTLLLSIMVPLALCMYIPTVLSVPLLRRTRPGRRAFNAPLGSFGPYISSGIFIAALVGWIVLTPTAFGTLKFIASLILFGIPIYLLLSIYYNPSTQLFFMDALAYPALFLENVILPKGVREKMLNLFGDLTGKTVLEFGAGVGSLTLHLAERVTKKGKVYAVESGARNVDLLLKRIEKRKHTHVIGIRDEHITNRLHPDVQKVDVVFSTGMLGYIQDKQKVLKEIARVMPEGGKICFMEWVDYFGLLPNPIWLTDLKLLRREFKRAGFSVRIEKVKGLFWNYLLVYGVKTDQDVPYA